MKNNEYIKLGIHVFLVSILFSMLLMFFSKQINNDAKYLVKKTMIFTCDKPLYQSDIENLFDNGIDEKNLFKNFRNSNTRIYKHDSFNYQMNNKNFIECIVSYYNIKPGEEVPFGIAEDYKKIEIVKANIAK